uniref:Voltage-gated hydrogen channel 1 n=1 Tax=Arion vulgaris TaxID=1028688 RepID=A0A0B7B5D0_9EUPU
MENRREVKENDTLLEMDTLNSSNDVGSMVQIKRPHAETNRLTDDTSPDDADDNDNALGMHLDDDNSSCDSSSEEDEHSHVIDPNSCKGKMATMMKSNVMQYCVISMVIADCVIIVLELLIDMNFITFPDAEPAQSHQTSDASHSLTNATTNSPAHHNGHNFSLHNSSHHDNSSHMAHPHSSKEKAEHILHACSLTILSLFMIEVSLKIFVEGKHLLRQKAEVFDAVVVIVSFTLDIVFSFVSVESAAKDAAGLMVLLRLWRVTRIINGVILSVKIEAKKKTDALKKIIKQLEKDNKKQRSRIDKLERENSYLRQQLTEPSNGSTGRTNILIPHKVSHGHHHHHHVHAGKHLKDGHGHKKDNHKDSLDHNKDTTVSLVHSKNTKVSLDEKKGIL